MSTVQKTIRFFEKKIFDFSRKAGREYLPWRREGISAYEVWVSEIMLQQTQVSRVLSYYEKFLLRFPNVEILSRASWEEFLPFYAGLGYYARGRNMLRTAKIVVEKFDGKFPKNIHELETLPGIGKYTATAIASFAYGENVIAWDTNVRRVVGRFFFGTKYADMRKFQDTNPKIQIISKNQFSNKKIKCEKAEHEVLKSETQKLRIENSFSVPAKILNAALMDFGSAICLGKPKCGACLLSMRCMYAKEKGRNERQITNNLQLTTNNRDDRQRTTDNLQRIMSGISRGRNAIWKEAKVEVTLHENHKKYFSSIKKFYKPFIIPASHNTRAGIKIWFRERYELEVSVRPPHGKIMDRGVPIILVNAQILTGNHSFAEFPKGNSRNIH